MTVHGHTDSTERAKPTMTLNRFMVHVAGQANRQR